MPGTRASKKLVSDEGLFPELALTIHEVAADSVFG